MPFKVTDAQLQAMFLAARAKGVILQDDVLIAIARAYENEKEGNH